MPVLEQSSPEQSSPVQADILRQFARGDLDAFETLFRSHQAEVYRWIVRIVRDSGVAEDLTVETFWRIHRSHARFDPRRNFEAWARRIASNAALDYLKSAHILSLRKRGARLIWCGTCRSRHCPTRP